MMHELVQRGWVCVAINYRLSPRATWPAHVVDCKRAVAWVREHIAEYGGDPGFIAVSGGSAGRPPVRRCWPSPPDAPEWQPGFEDARHLGGRLRPLLRRLRHDRRPRRSGAYGPGPGRPARAAGHEGRRWPTAPEVFEQASPDHRVTAAAPPMLVFHGVNDTLVPVEVARSFVARLPAASPPRWPTSSCPGPSTPSTSWPPSGAATPPWARSGSSRPSGPRSPGRPAPGPGAEQVRRPTARDGRPAARSRPARSRC